MRSPTARMTAGSVCAERRVSSLASSGTLFHFSPLASSVANGVPCESCSMLDQMSKAFLSRTKRRSSTWQPSDRRCSATRF
jgi:hypothetical protein